MQTIYRGNKTFQQFDFQKVSLSSPIRIGNGNYFMNYKANDQSLYVQPPQCLTKQGIINVSKKHYIDLLFTNEDADFIQWMEKLEESSVNYIYENRVKWFDGDMEKDDIENYFSSPFRIFRSGKYYILRVSIATTLGMPAVKVYDNDENEVSIDDINDTTQIMCILEIKGVKCGTRNFQIEMETKQLMIIKPSNPFDKCLFKVQTDPPVIDNEVASIKKDEPIESPQEDIVDQQISTGIQEEKEMTIEDVDVEQDDVIIETVDEPISVDTETSSLEQTNMSEEDIPEVPVDISYNLGNTDEIECITHDTTLENETTEVETPETEQSLGEQLEIMEVPFESDSNEMEEVSFPLNNLDNVEPIQLKERNDIYYEMYYEARRKAKMAKEMALNCYLEAKNIKNTYMLNDLQESDSDENVSEP
jgi:hypothetical protein